MTAPIQAPSMPIAEIVIADRHRKDMGDLDGLAASIAAIGLLHPVVVRTDGRLGAAHRTEIRIRRRLG